MKKRSTILLSVLVLATAVVQAQEEQAAASSTVHFWSYPRVQAYRPGPASESPRTDTAAPRNERAKNLTIENETLEVKWDGPTSRLTIAFKPSSRVFATNAGFNATGGAAKVETAKDKTFGTGKAIEVTYPNGDVDRIMLFPKVPFALVRTSMHNDGKVPTVTRRIRPFETTLDLGKRAGELKTFGTAGLLGVGSNPGSYDWAAVVDPETRNGVVFGWITHDRGDGVLFSKTEGDAAHVGAQIDYGRLRLAAGKKEELEMLAVGYFDDARIGLESWADAVAKAYNIRLPAQPVGYCTWYSRPFGGAADEEHIAQLSGFAAKELAPFGFSVVQIDDGWQSGIKTNGPKRVFTSFNPNGPYPAGMKATADKIKASGLVPGIWFMPFAGTATDPYFASHADWFVKREDGKLYETAWGGTCLDMTQSGARSHLREVASRICREWGFQYIKIDGLWTGTATRQQYINSGYRDDNIGDATLANPDKTNLEAYRDGLKLLREVIGPDVFILGCNGPQNMRSYGGAIGLVNGMRVGPDNKATWDGLLRGPMFGTRHYFMNGRVWYNDPDPVYVRDAMPIKHARLICSWAAISGQLNLSSEWLPAQPPERLEILKHTMPGHGLMARPADLFEKEMPSLWIVTDTGRLSSEKKPLTPRRDVVGIFNWDNNEQKFDYPVERLGLQAGTEYVAFDYWANALAPNIQDHLKIAVPGASCAVLSVRSRANHPQVISTSRHVTQGLVDVAEENWDDHEKVLHVRSKVVNGDPYELRIVVPGPDWKVSSVDTVAAGKAGPEATFAEAEGLVRTTIQPPASGEVEWLVKFK